jgi:uncharacterized membrane protein (DUF4010 family)
MPLAWVLLSRYQPFQVTSYASAMEMDPTEMLSRLAVSLAIGLLVGLERGWRTRDEEDRQRAAGFRTFALSGLLGGVTGAVSLQAGGLLVGFVFVIYAAAFAAFHWLEAKAEQNVSVTSVVAGMLTFLLGTMAVTGELLVAIACAVAMTVLLALRDQLHRWVASLTWPEIRSVLVLLAMSFLLLPVLPNRTIDPWNSINPYEIWVLAILIAAISFSGYVAVRMFGDRLGVVMTAMAGGLASSTATTLAFARLAREHPSSWRLLSSGVMIAGVVMMIRVGFVAVALNSALLAPLAPPLAVAAAVLALGSAILLFHSTEQENPKLRVDNPLAIGTALKLAAFIAGIMLAVGLLRGAFGSVGVLIVAALSGIADVDAVTISLARLNGEGIESNAVVLGILIAVYVNTTSKAVLAGWVGGKKVGTTVGGISAFAVLGGFGAALWSVLG